MVDAEDVLRDFHNGPSNQAPGIKGGYMLLSSGKLQSNKFHDTIYSYFIACLIRHTCKAVY